MIDVKTKKFIIGGMSDVDITVNYAHLVATSALSYNEAHIHKEGEIYFNLSGDVSFEVEDRRYPISRGSVIITRPYEYHHCIPHSNEPHEHFWISFSTEGTEDILKLFFDREKGKDNLILLNEMQVSELCTVLNSLLSKNSNTLQRRVDFLQIFRILSSGKLGSYMENLEELLPDLACAIRYMDDHLTEEFDIRILSSHCNVSVSTLERHFKEAFHMTPFALLRKKRLIASMEYLRNGESVTEAALKSGFSDYSNYIQLFRKQFGITPLKYKKNYELK